jgi:hypothetical protein
MTLRLVCAFDTEAAAVDEALGLARRALRPGHRAVRGVDRA